MPPETPHCSQIGTVPTRAVFRLAGYGRARRHEGPALLERIILCIFSQIDRVQSSKGLLALIGYLKRNNQLQRTETGQMRRQMPPSQQAEEIQYTAIVITSVLHQQRRPSAIITPYSLRPLFFSDMMMELLLGIPAPQLPSTHPIVVPYNSPGGRGGRWC